MKIDGGMIIGDLAGVPERIHKLEADGYDTADLGAAQTQLSLIHPSSDD